MVRRGTELVGESLHSPDICISLQPFVLFIIAYTLSVMKTLNRTKQKLFLCKNGLKMHAGDGNEEVQENVGSERSDPKRERSRINKGVDG